MRVAVGELWHETNSFSPVPTTGDDFRQHAGDAVLDRYAGTGTEVGGFIEAAASAPGDVELVSLVAARAVPGGPVEDEFFEAFTDRLLAGLDGRDVDGVLLSLHGSMVTDREADPEGTFLRRIRAAVGDRPVVASLDHHANVTEAMVAAADALVAYREHPHTGEGMRATGRRAATLLVDTVAGRLDPAMAMVKAPMITATRLETSREPMRSLFAERERLETGTGAENAAAVSLCPVHPYLDVPECGFAAVVVTDGHPNEAAEAAGTLARSAWDRRSEFDERLPGLDAVLDRLLAGGATPTVVADRGDVTLAGAPGDSPVVLRALSERPDAAGIAAAVPVVDRPAVEALFGRDGETERIPLGGTLTPAFEPIETDVVVEASFGGTVALEGSYAAGSEVDMGRRVVVRVADGAVRAIVSERPGITTDPSFFSAHGVDPAAADLLVVKSIGTFRPGFEPIAGAIEVADTPGISATDLSTFDYRRARPIHPLDDPAPSLEPVGDVPGGS